MLAIPLSTNGFSARVNRYGGGKNEVASAVDLLADRPQLADEIARIADGLFVPAAINERLRAL